MRRPASLAFAIPTLILVWNVSDAEIGASSSSTMADPACMAPGTSVSAELASSEGTPERRPDRSAGGPPAADKAVNAPDSATAITPLFGTEPVSAIQSGGELALREMEARFAAAVASRDPQAFLSFWAEDAAVFPPGKPAVVGRQNILKEWGWVLNDPDVSLTWEPDTVEVAASGDLGYTYGKYKSTGKGPDGAPTVHNGKYVSIWRKGPDGKWRVVVDLGTPSDPPPPKPAQ